MAISSGKSYTAGSFALEVEGQFAMFLDSVEGGSPYGPVISAAPGTDGVVHKHLGTVAYDDVVVTCGVPQGDWGQWIKGFLEGKAPQHDGAVVFLNYNYAPMRRMELRHATIAAVTFPQLGGSGKDTARLTVTLRVESTMDGALSAAPKSTMKHGKSWRSGNFTLDLPGVDCTRVSSVAPLTVSQALVEDDTGASRVPALHPGPLQVGDLVLAVSQSGAAGFTSWRDDFIVNGNNGAGQEKTATVRYLGANLQDELFTLVLSGVGIHRLDPDKEVAGVSSIARVTASMYCEQAAVSLPQPPDPGPAAPAPAAPAADAPAAPRRLGERPERLDPADVARRLQTSVLAEPVGPEDGQRQRGARLGLAWAQLMASLDELTQVATLARGEWTAVALEDGHSLVEALQESGIVPTAHSGDLELSRDSFVEGVVEGAASVYAEVRDHLERPDTPRT